jgi:hypothetical protein
LKSLDASFIFSLLIKRSLPPRLVGDDARRHLVSVCLRKKLKLQTAEKEDYLRAQLVDNFA